MRYVSGDAEIQVGVTTFVGRSHTEIARLIAYDRGWKLYGDQILEHRPHPRRPHPRGGCPQDAGTGMVGPLRGFDQLASLRRHQNHQRRDPPKLVTHQSTFGSSSPDRCRASVCPGAGKARTWLNPDN